MQILKTVVFALLMAKYLGAQDRVTYIPIEFPNDHSLLWLMNAQPLEMPTIYANLESWGLTPRGELYRPAMPPGMSKDLLNPYRRFLTQIPKASFYLVTKSTGAGNIRAFIFNYRFHSLPKPGLGFLKRRKP